MVPFSEELSTDIFPWWRIMICLHRLSPIPEPPDLVVKKGMNILLIASGAIPGPLSLTERLALPLQVVAEIVI